MVVCHPFLISRGAVLIGAVFAASAVRVTVIDCGLLMAIATMTTSVAIDPTNTHVAASGRNMTFTMSSMADPPCNSIDAVVLKMQPKE